MTILNKIRHAPQEDYRETIYKLNESSIFPRESSTSERNTTRKSQSSKRNRRSHNRSRLYENAQKLFNYSNPKKNQSIDLKTSTNNSKHIKYTTLLSKKAKNKLKIYKAASQNSESGQSKSKIMNNKYFSAPVSTKENGIVTKFKFNNTTNLDEVKNGGLLHNSHISQKLEIAEEGNSQKSRRRFDENQTETERQKRIEKQSKEMPGTEDIQRIFDNVGNTAKEKVYLMSVIQSNDNFEEGEEEERKREEESKADQSDSCPKDSNSSISKPTSAKAAVPILDFTNLPESKNKRIKSNENLDNNDSEMKSGSIGSIFDLDSHLDLSSKRLKKL